MLLCALLLLIISSLGCNIQEIAATTTFSDELYDEELVVRPLADSHVNTYFQFSTRWHYGAHENLHNTNLVPRVIADLLLEYDLKELHISLTQGLWRYEHWGYPTNDAAGGAEAWGWFDSGSKNLTKDDVDAQWQRLMSTFSGILCVSLNFIDKTNSISPKYGFRPQFVAAGAARARDDTQQRQLRYATLPREIVCTENLTPWKKLLPCGNSIGLVSLLNSGNVHNTKYHSLGLSLRTLCTADAQCTLELTQTANLVYDLKLLDGNRNDFSLRRLFGQGLNGRCALAKSSKIYIERSEIGAKFDLSPAAPQEVTTTRGGYRSVYAVYDLKQNKRGERFFNVACLERKDEKPTMAQMLQPPLIYANRFILGEGQQSGRIVTEITNTHYTSVPVVVQEVIPWFVALYLHTLQIRTKPLRATQYAAEELQPKLLHYVPSKPRTASTHLEIGISIPPKSTVRVSIDCDYMMLKWLEYPPDANNGHNIGSSVITTLLPLARNYTVIPINGQLFADTFNATHSDGYYQTLRTEALIVSLPTPDFSMPYNVICLACTVVALAFGPIHSVATKRMTIDTVEVLSRNMFMPFINKLFRRKQAATVAAAAAVATATTSSSLEEYEDENTNDIQQRSNDELINDDGSEPVHRTLS